jgi:AcrR family transcriptional regulator
MPARGGRRTRRSQAERTALSDKRMLEAAVALITQHGCHETTLQAIGRAAGYSRGLVSHRFGSKAGLFRAVVRWIAERWRQELDPAVEDLEGVEALCAFLDAHGRFARRGPEVLRALFILWFEPLNPKSELRLTMLEQQRRIREEVAAWIQAGIDSGRVRNEVRAPLQAEQFCATLYGITYQWLADPEHLDLDVMLTELKSATRALRV